MTKLQKVLFSIIIIFVLAGISLIIALLFTKQHEEQLNKEDSDIIEVYHDKNSKIELTDSDGNPVWLSGGDIDCVLYLDSIGVTLPVLKGNTEEYLAMFKTVLANNDMKLNETNYGIMGHHAIDMNVSLGGLDQINLGDIVKIEQNGKFYEYTVSDIVVEYADKRPDLFLTKGEPVVHLFTCDYSLGRGRTAYRIVTCTPNFEIEVKPDFEISTEKESGLGPTE